MTDLAALRRSALDWIAANEGRMSACNERIWHLAEPAWREYPSARAYVDFLRAEGFAVEDGSGGMPTTIVARWGASGPVLASFPEDDAVPGMFVAAKAEWRERTGGGVGGPTWVGPLLPADVAPPADLKWPEYLTTARGEEWCVPTPHDGLGAGERL